MLVLICLSILRVVLPILGAGFLVMESREIFELRQITSITLFVGLSVVVNFQMSVGRALIKTSEQRLGFKAV